tara:strand:+ start:537 stop:704 length:168 start_codon:yes stop_codon:yes gene_type:complete
MIIKSFTSISTSYSEKEQQNMIAQLVKENLLIDSIAQSGIEQLPSKQWVVGSNPT